MWQKLTPHTSTTLNTG